MNLYSVQTIWRHKKRYYTRTVAVMANYSADARGIARQGFLEDEIDNVRQRVWREHGCVVGESTRRCRHDMWDGVDSRRFIPEGHMPIAARVYYGSVHPVRRGDGEQRRQPASRNGRNDGGHHPLHGRFGRLYQQP